MSRHDRRVGWAGSALALALLCLQPLATVSASGAISQNYTTDSKSISKGALLSLVSTGSSSVEPANSTTNSARLAGVAADESLVEFSDSGKSGSATAKVVTSGLTEALVSDLNGPVKSGDRISASPVSGIGMKAVSGSDIIGTAQGDLATITTVQRSVTGIDGKPVAIKVGLLPILVNVTYYSAGANQDGLQSLVPSGVQSLANGIAGHPVTPLRILLGGLVLFLGFAVVGIMLYTSIRNGMISLGRNPMAQKIVRKGVVDIIIAALAILAISAGIVYAMLAI